MASYQATSSGRRGSYLTWIAAGVGVAGIAGSVFSGVLGSSGAKKQGEAIRYAADQGRKTALELNAQARADVAPFRELGVEAGARISDIISGRKSSSDTYKASSLYDFQSELGTKAINKQLAAKGMSGSGAGLETLALFDKSLVAEEGERYFNKLFGTTQLGANAAAQSASNTTSTGNTVANLTTQAGIAQGGAVANQYNALAGAAQGSAGAVRTGVSDFLTMSYLDRFFPPTSGGGGTPSGIPYDTVNIRGTGGGQPSGYEVHGDFSTFN